MLALVSEVKQQHALLAHGLAPLSVHCLVSAAEMHTWGAALGAAAGAGAETFGQDLDNGGRSWDAGEGTEQGRARSHSKSAGAS